MSRPVITLTTDFGLADGYVAAMRGAILSICPQAQVVDISHSVKPQAVQQAAYLLSTVAPYFPPGTVHVAVVDPGVGTQRRAVAVHCGRALYVAPDNGLLSLTLEQDPPRAAVQLLDARFHLPEVSATFHGRDIFAPVGAHLACGADLHEMGPTLPVEDLCRLSLARPERDEEGRWQAQVLHVDHFGNLITNLRADEVAPSLTLAAGGTRIEGLNRTFADVAPGELLAYTGSSGYVEIAVRQGSAARRLGLEIGDAVVAEEERTWNE
jgi:S-adenosyl-L-methionine hydrolase (adenosine-forming)